MPSLLSWKEVPANQRTLQGQSACCCLSSCVRPPKGQKWIIQGHHNLIRSPGHFLFQWVEVYCVWGMCVCVCVLLSAEMRLQFGVRRRESLNNARPLLSLSTYWLPLGWSQCVWQTECEAVCTTKVSVSVRGGHQHVCLMSLTLAWTLSGGSLTGSAHSRAFKMTGPSVLAVKQPCIGLCWIYCRPHALFWYLLCVSSSGTADICFAQTKWHGSFVIGFGIDQCWKIKEHSVTSQNVVITFVHEQVV